MVIIDYFTGLWEAELAFSGKSLIFFTFFIIMFMLIGRFRFVMIASLLLIFHTTFITNKELIGKILSVSQSGLLGSSALMIVTGAIFLVLAIWAFFIDSD
jgi:hypothetical protein